MLQTSMANSLDVNVAHLENQVDRCLQYVQSDLMREALRTELAKLIADIQDQITNLQVDFANLKQICILLSGHSLDTKDIEKELAEWQEEGRS